MDWEYSDITSTAALVISLFNLIYLARSRRVKLLVTVRLGQIGELVKIDVANISHFPITVVDVGIINGAGARQAVVDFANAAIPANLPCEVAARGIRTFTLNATTYMNGAKEAIRGGYARIADGKEFIGSTK